MLGPRGGPRVWGAHSKEAHFCNEVHSEPVLSYYWSKGVGSVLLLWHKYLYLYSGPWCEDLCLPLVWHWVIVVKPVMNTTDPQSPLLEVDWLIKTINTLSFVRKLKYINNSWILSVSVFTLQHDSFYTVLYCTALRSEFEFDLVLERDLRLDSETTAAVFRIRLQQQLWWQCYRLLGNTLQ